MDESLAEIQRSTVMWWTVKWHQRNDVKLIYQNLITVPIFIVAIRLKRDHLCDQPFVRHDTEKMFDKITIDNEFAQTKIL